MSAKTPGATAGPGFKLVGFPKEFERNFWESFDKRYYMIFLFNFVLFYGLAFFVASNDWQLSEDQINALKQRVIKKVYDVELLVQNEPEEEETGIGDLGQHESEEEEPEEVSERGKERVEESAAQKEVRRRQSQADMEQRSRQMQQEVANQGILAIATSAGGSGAGNVAYNDVLQDLAGAGGVGDIGSVVEGTAGIRTAGSNRDRTRAARGSGFRADGDGTGIDDLISGESVAGGASFSRRGKVELASENVKLTGGRGSRDPEAITASINKQSASVEYCYKRSARVNPNLRGRIDLEITIASSGSVTQARILESTLGDSRLEQCIVRAVKKWRFGNVEKGDVKIRVPFIF